MFFELLELTTELVQVDYYCKVLQAISYQFHHTAYRSSMVTRLASRVLQKTLNCNDSHGDFVHINHSRVDKYVQQYTDFAKVFDKVNHSILKDKLNSIIATLISCQVSQPSNRWRVRHEKNGKMNETKENFVLRMSGSISPVMVAEFVLSQSF